MSNNTDAFPKIGTLLTCIRDIANANYGWGYDATPRMDYYDYVLGDNIVFMGFGVELDPDDKQPLYYRIYFLDPKRGKTSLISFYFNKEGLNSDFSASFVPVSCGDDD